MRTITGHPIHFMFGSRWGFRGRRIERRYFRLHQIQDGGWPPSWKISNGHISTTGHPIDFVFQGQSVHDLQKFSKKGAWPGSRDPLNFWQLNANSSKTVKLQTSNLTCVFPGTVRI